MPLLDHFRPPVFPNHHWDSFHSNWATRLADALGEWLPPGFIAEEHTYAGSRAEIDVAAFEDPAARPAGGNGVAVAGSATYAPPAAPLTAPAVFPDSFEVRVFRTTGGLTLVGVVELVSPANKDRPAERRAFAVKTASYLHQGVSVVLVDIVTARRGNLHNETVRLFTDAPGLELPADVDLYAVAYRPVVRGDRAEVDIWPHRLAVGAELPTLPLRLTGDLFVPVELEATYAEACRRRHLA